MKYRVPNVSLDIEIYRNYALFGFMNVETGNVEQLEVIDGKLDARRLDQLMRKCRTLGFNSLNYDNQITWLAIKLAKRFEGEELCARLKKASDRIIQGGMKPWEFRDVYDINPPKIDHVDLFEVAPGMASLKIYGGRLHVDELQDLPYQHDAVLTREEMEVVRVYNIKDLKATGKLAKELNGRIELRCDLSRQYGMDLRSKSDAQIAEAVINSELQKITGRKPTKPQYQAGTSFKYKVPDYISFKTPVLKEMLETIRNTTFVVGQGGKVALPSAIKDAHIQIGSSVYRMGIGGLHSSEESVAHYADHKWRLLDRDVTSYYPAIILNQGLYPAHLGELFLKVYQLIVDRRVKAKAKQQELQKLFKEHADQITPALKAELEQAILNNEGGKIQINGSFGKFGSPYSTLSSPALLIQTTISGQLSLLMLIEMLENAGFPVVSANTDGVVFKAERDRTEELDAVIKAWEDATGFNTEETEYSALYSRDVNNYIALKEGGGYKAKGAYAKAGLMKNPANEVCIDAVAQRLMHGTPVSRTIRECTDITKFVTIRQVKGGGYKQWSAKKVPAHSSPTELLVSSGWKQGEDAKWSNPHHGKKNERWTTRRAYLYMLEWCDAQGEEEYLGKAVRWIYCTDTPGLIRYRLNGNAVPRTEGACPVMNLPKSVPSNIDYDWYIAEAESILKGIGYQLPDDIAELI